MFSKTTNSVFIITDKNNSFSISRPGHWNPEDSEEFFNKLNKLLELKSENDIELHLKDVEKRGTRLEIAIEICWYILAGFDYCKSKIFSESKRVKYRDLEGMVCRLQSTYHEILDSLVVKFVTGSTKGCILPPSIYELIDITLMLKSLIPKEVKVNNSNDDIRLKSNLTTKNCSEIELNRKSEESYEKCNHQLQKPKKTTKNKKRKNMT